MNRPPNIVFVLTDDQGYPPLACHGHPFIHTPNLDAFQAQSVRFEQMHTGTTCAPTRAGIMTGHTCNSTGVWHTIGGRSLLRRNEWSLADALRENGYRSGLFGKWHLGDEYPYRPQDRGFDTVVCHGGGGISQQPDWWGNDYFDDTYCCNGVPTRFSGYCTDVFFEQALQFIRSNRNTPFFCFISTNAPHSPFNVDPAYRDRYYPEKTDNEKLARFLGMISNIDENFGRLRALLQDLELEHNTILVFMSDNGQTGVDPAVNAAMFNAGMRGLKGSPYDGGHRVPFFIRWPAGDIGGGRDVATLAGYTDIMPTLLDLCAVPVPATHTFHGRSLAPLLRGQEDTSWDQRILVTDTQRIPLPLKWRQSCVMQNRWRLVNRSELYDIAEDPGQCRNLAERFPEVVATLQEAYEAWWEICSRQMQDAVPLSIGADAQDTTVLRSHDLRNEQDHAVVWNQGQVRSGIPCHGYWEVCVETSGIYEMELRRWPRETDYPIAAGIQGEDVPLRHDAIQPGAKGMYVGGNALPISTAYLDISGMPQHCLAVEPGDSGARFRVELEAGLRYIRARFADPAGFYTSAYYLYVRRQT